jgi:fibrillarin-like pre-rRNA processing protein
MNKLEAAFKKGVKNVFKKNDLVLYLGASHGITPGYISKMVSWVFCVEFSPVVMRDLLQVCESKKNMLPILSDANHPEQYEELVPKKVDAVYQDIAQKNQVEIFLKNCEKYLKKGYGMLVIKSRSIDVTKKPKEIYKTVKKQLEKEVKILDFKELDPYERDHAMFVVRKK